MSTPPIAQINSQLGIAENGIAADQIIQGCRCEPARRSAACLGERNVVARARRGTANRVVCRVHVKFHVLIDVAQRVGSVRLGADEISLNDIPRGGCQ